MKLFCLSLFAGAALVAAANPSVYDVSVTRDPDTGRVTVQYKIDAQAVVTADVRVNGESVDLNSAVPMAGDVNRLVKKVDTTCSFGWVPSGKDAVSAGADVKVAVTAWATNAPPDWLVINLKEPYDVRYYTTSNAVPYGILAPINKTQRLVMRKIPARGVSWSMGSVGEVSTWESTRESLHTVTLTEDYYIGIFPVTVGQYAAGYGYHGTPATAGNLLPRAGISYNSIRGSTEDGINWPNTTPLHKVKSGCDLDHFRSTTGFMLDLPTDAQWEYACRAGEGAALNNGTSGEENLAKIGWFTLNSDGATHEVGLLPPNKWGLYDMHGNVLEWCLDWIDENPLSDETDPRGITSGSNRVMRGGAYQYPYGRSRSAFREIIPPDSKWTNLGFRLVCPAEAVR